MEDKTMKPVEYRSYESYLEVFYPESSDSLKMARTTQSSQLGELLADRALTGFRQVLSSVKVDAKRKR